MAAKLRSKVCQAACDGVGIWLAETAPEPSSGLPITAAVEQRSLAVGEQATAIARRPKTVVLGDAWNNFSNHVLSLRPMAIFRSLGDMTMTQRLQLVAATSRRWQPPRPS